jgi:hypothetical protein
MEDKSNAIAPAYIAGLIDGEGCFSIDVQYSKNRKNRYFYLRLRIVLSEKDKDVLFMLQNNFGGNLNFRDISKSKNWRLHNTNNQWEYCLKGHKLISFMRDIEKHLIIKKEVWSKAKKLFLLYEDGYDRNKIDILRKNINGGRKGRNI